WSPDGKMLAKATHRPSVELWDVSTGQLVWGADAHTRAGVAGPEPGFATAVAFSPDGKHLASAGPEAIVISDVATGREVARWKHEKPDVMGLAFTPDGKTLLSGQSVSPPSVR